MFVINFSKNVHEVTPKLPAVNNKLDVCIAELGNNSENTHSIKTKSACTAAYILQLHLTEKNKEFFRTPSGAVSLPNGGHALSQRHNVRKATPVFFLNFSWPFFSLRPLFDGRKNEKRNSSLSRDVAVIYEIRMEKCTRMIIVTFPAPSSVPCGYIRVICTQVNAANTSRRHFAR